MKALNLIRYGGNDAHRTGSRERIVVNIKNRPLYSLGRDKEALISTLEIIDPVLGVQLISLVEPDLTERDRQMIRSLLEFRAPQSDVFKRYLEHVPKKAE